MKLRIEAESEEELRAKTPQLLERLAKAVRPVAPETANALDAAASPEHRTVELRHRALREEHADVKHKYTLMLEAMLAEIGQALDEAINDEES